MNAFIRTDQFNFIRAQVRNLISAHSTSNDRDVLDAMKSMILERVLELFPENPINEQLFEPIVTVKNKEDGEKFLSQVKPYVIPFKATEQGIKKLFPKAKKLKVPSLDDVNLFETTYLSWTDSSTNKRYIVSYLDEKMVGVEGSFKPLHNKGICAICNGHEDVGLYLVKEKGQVQGTFKEKGNYICSDSQTCNENITSLEKLNGFIDMLRK